MDANEKVRPAIEALRDYKQADEDGVMVLVSRQAVDEVLAYLATPPESAQVLGDELSLAKRLIASFTPSYRRALSQALMLDIAGSPEPPTDGPYFANKGDESERYAADVEREPAAQDVAPAWLPTAAYKVPSGDGYGAHYYTADQMREFWNNGYNAGRLAQPVGEVDEAMVERACAEGARQAGESWPLADGAKSTKMREHMRSILTAALGAKK